MADGSGGYEAFLAFMDNQSNGTSVPTDPQNGSAEAPKPSEDGYSYEEEQEREAMMKIYHHPMKQWFRQNPHLAEKYGAFPLFWQDLKNWAPYREVLKKFLRETEGGGAGGGASGEAAVDKANANASSNGAPHDGQQTIAEASGVADNSVEQQPKRRKKSRWGDAVEDAAPTTGAAAADDSNGKKKRKKSRWAPAGATPTTNLVSMLSQQQQQSVALRSRLEQINQKVMTVAVDAARIEKDPTRSPSPPPQYDNNGKRTNTREVRMRAALEKERQQIIEQMIKVNPLYRPPADYQRSKLTRKIYIPVNEYPSYNFIGLIIGPRGNTQKRMEKESNCKIAIRGKGSVKEGSKGKKVNSDENDDLHVLIIGEREEDLDRAAKEVRALLVPVDDMMNDHKQKQLRELALINGTLRDDDFCHLCGEKGHRQWECPNREKTFKAVDVRCSICGDSSHPTRDCTQRGKSAAETAEIDKEYQSFMQQLGEKPVISSSSMTTAAKPVVPAPAAAAPWLQPAKSASAATLQPWMKQATGAPGTSGGLAPPGTQPPGAPVLGSTPATAFPPPVAPSAAAYGAYPAQAQNWDQWNAYYYGQWDQSGAAVPATEYQQYGHYGPPAGATGVAGAGAGTGAAQPGAATPADYSSYQYQSYQSHAPQ